jgi:O-antigen/teichoic acid export membrane protein
MLSQNPPSNPMSLKRRSLRSGAWTFAGYGLGTAIRFAGNLVLTRLLAPDMFGLMAIATIVIVGLAMFSDMGLRPMIVRSSRGDDPLFLNTAWVLQIYRGVLLCLIGLGVSLAPVVASRIGLVPKNSVYADPRLPYVIASVSFTLLIAGFNSTKIHEAYRRVALGRVAVMEITALIVSLLFTCGWIFFDRSIAALIAGNIVAAAARMLLSHVWLPGVANHWQWEKSAFREIFHFGKWMFISSLLSFLVSNGDRLVLGGMVSSTLLGVYMIASMLIGSVEMVLMGIISGVMYPALSEIVRERPDTLRWNYYRMHAIIAGFSYFCSGVLMICGPPLIGLLYDSRYAQAGWMMQILAANMLIYPLQMAIQSFVALGMPKLQSYIVAIRLAALVMAMPLGFHFFGLAGALWGIVASQYVCLPITVFYSARHELFDLRRELLSLPMVLVGAGVGEILAIIISRFHGF